MLDPKTNEAATEGAKFLQKLVDLGQLVLAPVNVRRLAKAERDKALGIQERSRARHSTFFEA